MSNKLPIEIEDQIYGLFGLIVDYSKLYIKPKSPLVKISSFKLNQLNMAVSDAVNFIRFVIEKMDITKTAIFILNDGIMKYNGQTGFYYDDTFFVVDGLHIGDDKDSLVLWIFDLNALIKNLNDLFEIDLSDDLKAYFKDGEIVVNDIRLPITPNNPRWDFCKIVFDYDPRSSVGYRDILEKTDGEKSSFDKLSKSDKRSIENLAHNINADLKVLGLKRNLFSLSNGAVHRNF